MKTAISIDDRVFQQAETAAKALGLSRSALYTQAVEEYVKNHLPSEITRKYDQIFSSKSNGSAEFNRIAADALSKAEWE